MTKSVLVIAKAFPPVVGGVESYSQWIVREYLRRNFIVVVVTQTTGASTWSKRVYPEGTIDLYNTGPGNQFFTFLSIYRKISYLDLSDFDFIHATTWRPAVALLPFLKNVSLVCTVHGREVLNYPLFLRSAMIAVLKRSRVVVTVSNATMEIAKGALRGKQPFGQWVCAFNGLSFCEAAANFRRPEHTLENLTTIFSLSRHVPRKNIQGCLLALAKVSQVSQLNFKYLIGGEGPLTDHLKKLVGDLGLEEKVEFLGHVADCELPSLYKQSDIFLHPQTHVGEGRDFEGFGLVIADALSFGCAVIAGQDGGPSDFINNEVTGLLIDGGDVDLLETRISKLMTDHEYRIGLGENGREYALANLSWSRHVDSILGALNY